MLFFKGRETCRYKRALGQNGLIFNIFSKEFRIIVLFKNGGWRRGPEDRRNDGNGQQCFNPFSSVDNNEVGEKIFRKIHSFRPPSQGPYGNNIVLTTCFCLPLLLLAHSLFIDRRKEKLTGTVRMCSVAALTFLLCNLFYVFFPELKRSWRCGEMRIIFKVCDV